MAAARKMGCGGWQLENLVGGFQEGRDTDIESVRGARGRGSNDGQ